MPAMLGRMTNASDHGLIRLIALFKLGKAMALLLLAAAAFDAARAGVLVRVSAWLGGLPLAEAHAGIHQVMDAVTGLTPRGVELIGMVALLYASLFAIEGFGLWAERGWAENLTMVATASLVPFEAWALLEHATALRAGALLINVSIAIYIFRLVRRKRKAVRSTRSAA